MSRPFSNTSPMLRGPWEPWPMEGEVRDCAVVGEIPRDLAGALYRNGPNPQFAPTGGYHFFLGDGMIHAFHFEDGHCRYRNHFVRTPRFEAEREAGMPLFGNFFEGEVPDARAAGIRNGPANTNVVWHAGRLLALVEGGLPPVELDPETLETRGVFDFEGKLRRPVDPGFAKLLGIDPANGTDGVFTAHPKLDPESGEMLAFGYFAVNGHTEGRHIVGEVAQYPRLPLPREDGGIEANASLVRWTLDLDAGTVKQQALDDRVIEFPRFDERRTGLDYRYGFAGSGALGAIHGLNQLVRYDLCTGPRTRPARRRRRTGLRASQRRSTGRAGLSARAGVAR